MIRRIDGLQVQYEEVSSDGFMYGPSYIQLRGGIEYGWTPHWWAVCPNKHCRAATLCVWMELSRYDRCLWCAEGFEKEQLTYEESYLQPRTLGALSPEDQKAASAAYMLGGWEAAKLVCQNAYVALHHPHPRVPSL